MPVAVVLISLAIVPVILIVKKDRKIKALAKETAGLNAELVAAFTGLIPEEIIVTYALDKIYEYFKLGRVSNTGEAINMYYREEIGVRFNVN